MRPPALPKLKVGREAILVFYCSYNKLPPTVASSNVNLLSGDLAGQKAGRASLGQHQEVGMAILLAGSSG